MSETRKFRIEATQQARDVLDELLQAATNEDTEAYRVAMRQLGRHLASAIYARVKGNPRFVLACTVEDADFLALGLLEKLEELSADRVAFACFWNEGTHEPYGSEDFEYAPIVKVHKDPFDDRDRILVIVKSIISGACVVATNLSNMISDLSPPRIFVVAPVMLAGAEDRLSEYFETDIASRFEYVCFAEDSEKHGSRVVPGVGGDVYKLYGFGDAEAKNRVVPNIVKERRRELASTR